MEPFEWDFFVVKSVKNFKLNCTCFALCEVFVFPSRNGWISMNDMCFYLFLFMFVVSWCLYAVKRVSAQFTTLRFWEESV
jgi:hypothetical protein